MKKMMFAVGLAAGVAAGFVVGRMCTGGSAAAEPPQAPVVDDALNKAEKRIAALEAELAEAKNDTRRVRRRMARAEEAVEKALKEGENEKGKEGEPVGVSFSVGTNMDVVAEMKRQLPEEAFVAATNVLERMKVANAERRKGRREYLASLDVSGLSKKDQENHRRFMEMFDRREKAMSKMKGLIPDEKTINELMQIEIQMRPLAKQERKALLGGVARELGYTGEDGVTITDTLEGIFDCTGTDGLGGLGEMMGGLMDGAEGQPGVSVETHVIGL